MRINQLDEGGIAVPAYQAYSGKIQNVKFRGMHPRPMGTGTWIIKLADNDNYDHHNSGNVRFVDPLLGH